MCYILRRQGHKMSARNSQNNIMSRYLNCDGNNNVKVTKQMVTKLWWWQKWDGDKTMMVTKLWWWQSYDGDKTMMVIKQNGGTPIMVIKKTVKATLRWRQKCEDHITDSLQIALALSLPTSTWCVKAYFHSVLTLARHVCALTYSVTTN